MDATAFYAGIPFSSQATHYVSTLVYDEIEHIKKKDKVGIIIASEGITARDDKRNYEKSKKKIIELSKISKKISKDLKVSFIDFFSFPDNRLDSVNLLDIVKRIEDRVLNFKPKIFFNWFKSSTSTVIFFPFLFLIANETKVLIFELVIWLSLIKYSSLRLNLWFVPPPNLTAYF